MLPRATKRNAALSLTVHLALLALLWWLSVNINSKLQLIGQVVLYYFVLAALLGLGIVMLLLRYTKKMKLRFSFLYQFAGIGNLVFATLGIVLSIMGEPDWMILLVILSMLIGFEIEKDIFTADTDRR